MNANNNNMEIKCKQSEDENEIQTVIRRKWNTNSNNLKMEY